ncbi:MAG: TolC family outer membrane protein [Alphaproteobacteria bacterium]|nr:TolC family outer membrane protein [Alphaproteobacteria bacterium]
MKKTFLSVLLIASALSGTANAQSIFEALSSAYNTNPTLQAQRAYLRAVDENVAIAKSGYRPNVYLQGSYTDADVDSNIAPKNQDNTKTSLAAKVSQPLFNGFSTVNGVKSADSLVRSEQNNLYNVEQQVFLEASTAYLDVVKNTAIVDLQKNNEKLLKKRLDETKERFNVGEVTRTDVSQAQARYSKAISDRIASEGDLEASKAVYTRIIGENPGKLNYPSDIRELLPKNFNDALDYTRVNNYSIKRAKELLNSKTYDVAANNGSLLPTVTLDGEVSKNKTSGDMYDENPEIDNVQWGVNMKVPLYSAGETRAKIRQSKYQKWQAQEQVMEAERQAVSDVTSSWEYMMSNKAKIKSIKDQVKANEVALDGVQKEEALGNRTILDVLDAYQELLNSNVEEVKARRDFYVSGMSLLLSMGKLTAEELKLNVDLYDAKKYYKETRGKWLSLSVDK